MNTRIVVGSVVLAALTALLLGCEPAGPVTTQGVLTRSASNPPLPPQPPGSQASTADRKTNPFDRADTAPVESASGAPAAVPTSTATETTDSTPKPSIRLSVGLALPQTLPDGTQVGVSVDYKITAGKLNSAAKYVWVIESRQGETAMEVQIAPQGGNLASFLPISIRPGDSPFRARIDEVSSSGSRVRVSNVEELR